jgi:hypothetical protein
MPSKNRLPSGQLSCTAFDHSTRIASGSYFQVALALKEHARKHADASVLIFDDATGRQIDFDLRGTDVEILARISKRFPGADVDTSRSPGRPKLGVVAREVTLLPRHWDWLAEQSGGASVTLRRLVDDALRAGPSDKVRLRKLHERVYHFMSAIAGNYPNFEEASRALFANNLAVLKELISTWPSDVQDHVFHLCSDDTMSSRSK